MSDFEAALAAYDLDRQAMPGEPFCHAPFVNLHFSHGGTALACCHNRTYTLGTYPEDSVADMWNGERAQQLRQAVAGNDLSQGCQLCARQLLARDLVGLNDMAGSYADSVSRAFWKRIQEDGLGLDEFARVPRKLEFEIHNSCNLECVMCHGAASSSIRKHRDALPALASPYDEAFVDQLSPYLPDVHQAGFTGGEPFLIPLYYKIWERIADRNRGMLLLLVTNGTTLNDRVRRVVEDLDFVINVSVDSIVKETYESIRKGASLKLVLENSRYFADVMARKGRPFIWRCCVMRQNWREMPEMVRFCDDNGIRITFNQVEFPLDFSLHTLSPSELREIVDYLRTADAFDANNPVQLYNHQQYRGLLQRLEGFVEPETWRNAFVDRLETARANPMLNGWSTQGMRLHADPAADVLAEKVSTCVATRLTIEQATRSVGHSAVPSTAWDTLANLRGEVSRLRAKLPPEVFLRVLLNVAIRTYVRTAGVTAEHGVHVFDRIDPVVQLIMQHPDRDEIADEIVTCSPAKLYEQVVRHGPLEIEALRGHHQDAGSP